VNRRKPSAFGVYSSPSRWRILSAFMRSLMQWKAKHQIQCLRYC
jgi:hypothetical protein